MSQPTLNTLGPLTVNMRLFLDLPEGDTHDTLIALPVSFLPADRVSEEKINGTIEAWMAAAKVPAGTRFKVMGAPYEGCSLFHKDIGFDYFKKK